MKIIQSLNYQQVAEKMGNISGTFNASKALFKPSLIKPQLTYSNFNELPIPLNNKIKAIVLDKDNCIAYPHETHIWEAYTDQWEKLKRVYPGKALLIVSNTAGSNDDKALKGSKIIETNTGVHVLRHSTKKPGCHQEIMQYFRDNKIAGKPDEIAVIGDRLFTDIMMANLMNSCGIWLKYGVVKSNNPLMMFERFLSRFF